MKLLRITGKGHHFYGNRDEFLVVRKGRVTNHLQRWRDSSVVPRWERKHGSRMVGRPANAVGRRWVEDDSYGPPPSMID